MTNIKRIPVTEDTELAPGDRIRVEFEGKIASLDEYDLCARVRHVVDGEETMYASYIYINDDPEDIGLTVEKLVETPDLKLGQVWQHSDSGERFSVYSDAVPGTNRVISLNSGATFSKMSFQTLYPNAELILDA